MSDSFSFAGRIRSLKHACGGILEMLRSQHNAWLHLLASVVVIAAGIGVDVTRLEWCVLILTITSVWVCEAFNTALEFLCDVASPEFHPLVKKSKDVAAGAVLLSVVGAVIIGLLVFTPYLVAS